MQAHSCNQPWFRNSVFVTKMRHKWVLFSLWCFMIQAFDAVNYAYVLDQGDTRIVGVGLAATVFLGVDLTTQERVAIKVFHEAHRQSFLMERDALSKIIEPHPNVVRYYESIVTPSMERMIVMEYIEGETLEAMRRHHGTIDHALIPDYISQLLHALHHIHSYGIIHRDVFPQNIMINRHGQLKLIDFSMSSTRKQATRGCSTPCTSMYSDPVMLEGEYGMAVDYYAVATTLHVLWTNNLLTQGKRDLRTGVRQVDEVIALLANPNQDQRWHDCYLQLHSLLQLPFFTQSADEFETYSIEEKSSPKLFTDKLSKVVVYFLAIVSFVVCFLWIKMLWKTLYRRSQRGFPPLL